MNDQQTTTDFLEKHSDTVFEWHYQMVKEASWELYLWGLRTDNMDAIKIHKQMLRLYRTYDKKFLRESDGGKQIVN